MTPPPRASAPAQADVDIERSGSVLTVVLNRPGAHNALTWRMYDAIESACVDARNDPGLRAVVFRGAGGRAFAAGTDIGQFASFQAGTDGTRYEARVEGVLRAVLDLDVPTTAVIDGYAVGAGLLLAAACDVRICGDTARFGVPIARTLANAISQFAFDLLADRLGSAPTLQALVTAELFDAARAHQLGFVHRVVASADLAQAERELVDGLALSAPLTIRAFKQADRARRTGEPGPDFVAACYGSADFAAGVAAFTSRAPRPAWTGR